MLCLPPLGLGARADLADNNLRSLSFRLEGASRQLALMHQILCLVVGFFLLV